MRGSECTALANWIPADDGQRNCSPAPVVASVIGMAMMKFALLICTAFSFESHDAQFPRFVTSSLCLPRKRCDGHDHDGSRFHCLPWAAVESRHVKFRSGGSHRVIIHSPLSGHVALSKIAFRSPSSWSHSHPITAKLKVQATSFPRALDGAGLPKCA